MECSKKQRIAALTSAEAEYCAVKKSMQGIHVAIQTIARLQNLKNE